MPEQLSVDVADAVLRADRWPGDGPTIVLLHSGVGDRRSWSSTAELLTGRDVVAYDRRGVGESSPAASDFSDVDDLRRLIETTCPDGRACLVGSSMGGRVALDLAVQHPDLVAALVLLAPAISGAPGIEEVDPDTQRLGDRIDAAEEAGDLDEVNRLETWLWLDGPTSPEGRVGGAARSLAVEMNAALLRREHDEQHSGSSGVDAWQSLEHVHVPTTIACGDLDVPFFVDRCREVARRIPGARHVELSGMAHLPYLEQPRQVADLISRACS